MPWNSNVTKLWLSLHIKFRCRSSAASGQHPWSFRECHLTLLSPNTTHTHTHRQHFLQQKGHTLNGKTIWGDISGANYKGASAPSGDHLLFRRCGGQATTAITFWENIIHVTAGKAQVRIVKLMMAELHLAGSFSGSWYRSCSNATEPLLTSQQKITMQCGFVLWSFFLIIIIL